MMGGNVRPRVPAPMPGELATRPPGMFSSEQREAFLRFPPSRGDNLEQQIQGLDRLLDSATVRRILELMEENLELKAQLKIQQVEADARARIHEIESRSTREVMERMERQHNELREELGERERALARSVGNATQAVGKESQEKAARELAEMKEAFERRSMEQAEEYERRINDARRGNAELEHRVRTLGTQLEQTTQALRAVENRREQAK